MLSIKVLNKKAQINCVATLKQIHECFDLLKPGFMPALSLEGLAENNGWVYTGEKEKLVYTDHNVVIEAAPCSKPKSGCYLYNLAIVASKRLACEILDTLYPNITIEYYVKLGEVIPSIQAPVGDPVRITVSTTGYSVEEADIWIGGTPYFSVPYPSYVPPSLEEIQERLLRTTGRLYPLFKTHTE